VLREEDEQNSDTLYGEPKHTYGNQDDGEEGVEQSHVSETDESNLEDSGDQLNLEGITNDLGLEKKDQGQTHRGDLRDGLEKIPIVGDVTNKALEATLGDEKDGQIGSTLESVPIVGDVAKEFKPETQDPNETETEKVKEGMGNIPVVGDMTNNVIEAIEPDSNVKDESSDHQTKQDVQSVEVQDATPIAEELIKDTLPEDSHTSLDDHSSSHLDLDEDERDHQVLSDKTEDDNESHSLSEAIHDTQNLSQDLDAQTIDLQAPVVDQHSVKNEDMKMISPQTSEHDSLKTKDDSSPALHSIFNSSSHTSHDDISSFSNVSMDHLDLSPMQETRDEEYVAETEVVAHVPEHHSMKDDSMAKEIIQKHLDDSSASSSDNDSGVSKIELTDIAHDSNEIHHSVQGGHSEGHAGLFGATSQSVATAGSVSAKTVTTDVTKIKFQHSRKYTQIVSSMGLVLSLLFF
jgi:hypothetical protein